MKQRPFGLHVRALRALITRPSRASCVYIAAVIWGDGPHGWPDNWGGTVKVLMCRLRRPLAEHGITITSDYRGNYRLDVPAEVDIEAVFRAVRDRPLVSKFEEFFVAPSDAHGTSDADVRPA